MALYKYAYYYYYYYCYADRVKDVDRHLFFDKVKSLDIDSCLYEIPKNDLVDDMKLWPSFTFPDVLLL